MSATARIVLFHPEQGYGYIQLIDSQETFRFKANNWLGQGVPTSGQLVSFQLRNSKQGYYADQIRPAPYG